MKSSPDGERFARYQSVVNALLAKESFEKPDIYKALREEQKPFIGKVIGELVRDGYLTQNLLMGKDDVDYLPIFVREGLSWGKLDKVFDGALEEIIHEINTAIAA